MTAESWLPRDLPPPLYQEVSTFAVHRSTQVGRPRLHSLLAVTSSLPLPVHRFNFRLDMVAFNYNKDRCYVGVALLYEVLSSEALAQHLAAVQG